MADSRFFHNPRCSKSHAALELLHGRGVFPRIVAYLDTPPGAEELHALAALLGVPVREWLRTSEPEYADQGLADPTRSDAQILTAMAAHPRLIERPIFVHGGRAVIGRPPERVLELLD